MHHLKIVLLLPAHAGKNSMDLSPDCVPALSGFYFFDIGRIRFAHRMPANQA